MEKALRATRVAVLIGTAGEPLSLAFARRVATGEVEGWQAAWLLGQAETLDCDRADTIFPTRLRLRAEGAGTVGRVLLGPRPDGSFYGKDRREALAEIAEPVARAVHVVRQRASLNARTRPHPFARKRNGAAGERARFSRAAVEGPILARRSSGFITTGNQICAPSARTAGSRSRGAATNGEIWGGR